MENIKKTELITKELILSMIFSFFVFLAINLPSVKLLYSSIILNFVALLGILTFGVLRWVISNRELPFNHKIFRFSCTFLLFWLLLLLVTWFAKPPQLTLSDLLQYVSIIPFTLGILYFLEQADFKFIAMYQIVWGTSIAFVEWSVGIPKESDLGQNYLTTGVVIAATVMIVIGMIFSRKIHNLLKLLLLIPLSVLFLGLSSLSGRAPILLSVLIPLLFYFLSTLMERNFRKKLVTLTVMIMAVTIVFYVLSNTLNEYTINRIMRIFTSIQDEPRFEVYVSSVQVITENPFGIGLTGFRNYDFGYPHNIFLEVIMSGGVLALIPFLVLIGDYLIAGLHSVKRQSNSIIWLSLSMYYFLTWNISFNLSSSYMVFITLAVFIKASSYSNEPAVEPFFVINADTIQALKAKMMMIMKPATYHSENES